MFRHAGALLCWFLSSAAVAEDGLVVHFTITKATGNQLSTYSNGVLMRLTAVSTMTFPGLYDLTLESRAVEKDRVNLIVTLNDRSTGKPIYAGSGAATLQVGTATTIAIHSLAHAQSEYAVRLSTAYGPLPPAELD